MIERGTRAPVLRSQLLHPLASFFTSWATGDKVPIVNVIWFFSARPRT